MKIQFKCELLTDVVLNMNTGTTGNQKTLDFIPGNCFLGIVASSFQHFGTFERDILFSGKVRFGDAHVASHVEGEGLYRTLHIPASMMYPKLSNLTQECYIQHYYSRGKDQQGPGGHPMQLKQSRKGYYIFKNGYAQEILIEKSFVIKSAYDRVKRRAEDEQMYGYESIDKGNTFLFEVEVDDERFALPIKQALLGDKRVGRSRTAQYGLIRITEASFSQPSSRPDCISIEGKRYVSVYADGRLIFFDNEGNPTFRPTAEDLGLKGEICWEKSQVRTFQYSPYNFKRQARDADRCGIEKGSVFLVETDNIISCDDCYVGSFRNEGFGKIIFNPDFLEVADTAINGESKYVFRESARKETNSTRNFTSDNHGTGLLTVLYKKKNEDEAMAYIYKKVNEFVSNNARKFKDAKFASQWGNIRSIAMRCTSSQQLLLELFDKTQIVHHYQTPTDPIEKDVNLKTAYLVHGVTEKQWREKKQLLKDFINEVVGKSNQFNRDITLEAVINLASEMAKKCNKQ